MTDADGPLPSHDLADQLARGPVGDAASATALNRVTSRLARPKAGSKAPAAKARAALTAAVAAIKAQDYLAGAKKALEALKIDERWFLAWHVLAISREKAGDLGPALTAYETALKLAPDEADLAHDLGRLAQRLGYLEIAEKLLLKFLATRPGHKDAANNLACVLRDQQRYAEAVALLTECITAAPEAALFWNTLGTVMTDQGEMEQSLVFFDEALRLEPDNHKALYNRANALNALGDPARALADIDAALPRCADAFESATMRMARALTLMRIGDLEAAFDEYEARFDPRQRDALALAAPGEIWDRQATLEGRRLLVFGEQGLGDEVLFANAMPDIVEAVGSGGAVTLAVEHRLVPLMQRSFPEATVVRHRTIRHAGRLARAAMVEADATPADLHAPIGSLFGRLRPTLDAFPDRPFLIPDAEAVARWRDTLATLGPEPTVGVCWKSLKLTGSRARCFSPFELWRPVLETPGVRFVNLQYGDCAEELAAAREAGLPLWEPDLDMKDDLDGVAALTTALDLVIGPANATTNIAGACGANVWMIATPDAWTGFGSGAWPCYPSVRAFPVDGYGRWEGVMGRLAEALAQFAVAPRRAAA